VQPRPGSYAAVFHCKAVIHDDAGADLLEDTRRPLDSWVIEFKLFVTLHYQADFTDYGDWRLKPTRVRFCTGHPHSDIFQVRDRLVGALPLAFERLRPETMLKPACLFCGKRLTDPVSIGAVDRPSASQTRTGGPRNIVASCRRAAATLNSFAILQSVASTIARRAYEGRRSINVARTLALPTP
jgi:hypothetical protein